MIALLVFVYLLLCMPMVLAASGISPPSLPPEERGGDYFIVFRFLDAHGGTPLANHAVQCSFAGASPTNHVSIERFSDASGLIYLYLSAGTFEGVCMCDSDATPGSDYASNKLLVNVGGNASKDILMYPVATVIGKLYVNRAIAPGAGMIIRCPSEVPDSFARNTTTDQFGSFTFKGVPAGECTIYGITSILTGSVSLNLTRGDVYPHDLILTEQLSSGNDFWSLPAAILAVVVTGALLGFVVPRFRTPPKHQVHDSFPADRKEEKSKLKSDARMSSVMKTLEERECALVELLLARGGELRQRDIRKELMIPKATFFRMLIRLKSRCIIDIEKYENRAMVRLTRFFLTGKSESE